MIEITEEMIEEADIARNTARAILGSVPESDRAGTITIIESVAPFIAEAAIKMAAETMRKEILYGASNSVTSFLDNLAYQESVEARGKRRHRLSSRPVNKSRLPSFPFSRVSA